MHAIGSFSISSLGMGKVDRWQNQVWQNLTQKRYLAVVVFRTLRSETSVRPSGHHLHVVRPASRYPIPKLNSIN